VEFDSFKLLCRNSLKKIEIARGYIDELVNRSHGAKKIVGSLSYAQPRTNTQVHKYVQQGTFDVHFISKRHLPSGLMGYSLPSFELLFKGMMGAYEENDNNVPFFLPFSCCVKESERRAEKKKRVRLGCSQQDLNVPRR
jgi:hypothetical protein